MYFRRIEPTHPAGTPVSAMESSNTILEDPYSTPMQFRNNMLLYPIENTNNLSHEEICLENFYLNIGFDLYIWNFV